jgi:hypothetical protein
MSFKSRKPPAVPQIPVQPAPAEVMDIIDEIAGTQTITVNLGNGKKQRVTKRLPRTKEEDEVLKRADELMAQAVSNIQQLYRFDPASVADYQPFIQTFSQINEERMADLGKIGNFEGIADKVASFKQMNKELSERAFDVQAHMNDEILAKRGLSNSTMAAEMKAATATERALMRQRVAADAERYGDDLMNRQLDREGRAYDIQEAGRQGRLQAAQTGYSLERQKQDDEERARQNAIAQNEAILGIGRGLKGDELQKSQLALAYGTQAQNAAFQQNTIQNNRYANEVTRLGRQHQMEMDRFRETPATFGQQLVQLGGSLAGQAAGTYVNSLVPGAGSFSQPEQSATARLRRGDIRSIS